jgi:hypothetical protein
MTVDGIDSAKAKTGDVVNHVFSDRGVAGGRRSSSQVALPDSVKKWGLPRVDG